MKKVVAFFLALYAAGCGGDALVEKKEICDNPLQMGQICEEVDGEKNPWGSSPAGFNQCYRNDMGSIDYCCCKTSYDAGSVDASGGQQIEQQDIHQGPIISGEKEGIAVLVDALHQKGYTTEVNKGSWKVVLKNPDTGKYDLQLNPDIRFKKGDSTFSYVEFSSAEDPGIGVKSKFPLYVEIEPGTKSQILATLDNVL